LQIAKQLLAFGSFPQGWTDADLDGNVVMLVVDESDVDARWPRFVAGHPDFVKVFLLYSEQYALRKDAPRFAFKRGLDPALVPAIVRRAHDANLRVSAHVYTAADFHNAVAAGVDDVAHMPGTGYDADLGFAAFRIAPSDADLAARRGVTVTTTVSWLADEEPTGVVAEVLRPNFDLLRKAGASADAAVAAVMRSRPYRSVNR
jgi:hypothetical protein